MCINYQTSVLSFLLGEISGLLLFLSDNKEKKRMGLFVMFYSLVQFCELNIYNNTNVMLNSKLLLLNLGLQSLIFFLLFSDIYAINHNYIIISSLIGLYIFVEIFNKNFKKSTIDNCIEWNFLTPKINFVLGISYFLLFFFLYTQNCTGKFLCDAKKYFTGTILLSYVILNNKNSPSIWCLSSALLAPILVFL